MLAAASVLSARLSASDAVVAERFRPESQMGAGAPAGRPVILLAQKGAAKKKKGAAKAETTGDASPAATEKTTATDSGLKFSRDIAPIFVGNCIGCHNPERKRGKFDLTTFEKLMGGAEKEKVIEPGKPDESHLVLRLRGEETPKMPQGNNNVLSDEAIAKVESWVKAGAKLDAGIDPKAPLKSYAPTPDQIRAAELRKMPAAERDKLVITTANARWKQASPKNTPEVTSGTHFLLFSTLPKDRAAAVMKGMDTAYAQLRALLSRPGEPALDWPVKTTLFAFNDQTSLVEFARTLENRELEASDAGTANFGTQEPYIAVVDPIGGREEPSASARKASRSRRTDDDGAVNERSVAGMMAEQMALGVLKNEKNAPSWLCLGVGAYYAAALDPKSSYVHRLRSAAVTQYKQGWPSRANDALGGQLKTDDTRAIGYAFVDWLMQHPQARRSFPAFVRGMIIEGGTKLDDVLQNVFGLLRQDFIYSTGEWTAHYGGTR